ncbi:MAG: translation elongation factor Ts [Candidatus Zixiibacteriota bacterium]
MDISAKMVKELREKTGAGMMDCKSALGETGGDFEKAIALLREKGIAKAGSKEGRTTSEGIIASQIGQADKLGVLVEINCETDFVARTEQFKAFAREIANQVASTAVKSVDELLNSKLISSNAKTVSEHLKGLIGSLGENTQIKRFVRFEGGGLVTAYIHPGDKLGVIVEVATTKSPSDMDKFRTFSRDIAMQVAAMSPKCVRREELDQTAVASEREIYRHQAQNEGKPANIVDKIADSKIEKWYAEVVLMEQRFVKDNDKTIGDVVKEHSAAAADNFVINRFARFRLGE